MLMNILYDYENSTAHIDEDFPGGLLTIASFFMADMDDTYILVRDWINRSDNMSSTSMRKARCIAMK